MAGGEKYLQVSTDEVYGILGADSYFMETTLTNLYSPLQLIKKQAQITL